MNRTTSAIKGLLSLALLIALLVGIPMALVAFAPLHLPHTIPTWTQVSQALTTPDNGSIIITVVAIIGWIAWASFAVATLLELPAAVSSWTPPRLRAMSLQQELAAALLAAITVGFALPGIASTAQADPVDLALTSMQATDAHAPAQTPTTTTTATEAQPQTAPATTTSSSEQDKPATHVVEPGENLWEIAEETTGNGSEWSEIADLNRGVPQTDGQSLQDPSIIQPGWTLTLPDTATASQASQPAQDDSATQQAAAQAEAQAQQEAQATADAQAQAQATAAATQAAQDQQAAPATQQAAAQQEDQAPAAAIQAPADETAAESSPTSWIDMDTARTAGGIGVALAMTIIGVLAYRRRHSQHDRPLGTRMATPDPQDSILEAQLRQVADPVEMTTVDRALRSMVTDLGHVPDIRAARMKTDVFELYLHEPATLPAPWEGTADDLVWTITAADLPTQDIDTTAPYPSLVTVGIDDEGAQVLVDLEHVRTLDLRGDAETSMAAMAAMATELSLSPWADDLQITLVDVFPELADALDTGRIRYVNGLDSITTELHHRADQVAAALADTGETLATARQHTEAATWSPEILLIPRTISAEQARELDELLARTPRVGVAMVSEADTDAEWALTFSEDRAVLEPAGLAVAPQLLTPSDYAHVLSLLEAPTNYVAGPAWTRNLETLTEATVPEAVAAAQDPEPVLEEAPESIAEESVADDEADDQSAPVAEVHDITQPVRTSLRDVTIVLPEPASPGDLDEEPGSLAPYLRLLGPVDLEDARGVAPAKDQRQKVLEAITFLALNPTGVGHDRIAQTLWAGREVKASTLNSCISRARRWLGDDADGEAYLPRSVSLPTGGSWALQGVSSDWDTFQRLIGEDPTQTPLSNLTRALDLVTGTPLTGSRRAHFVWADSIRQDLVSTITDVAHTLATRAIKAGHPLIASHAAHQALLATHDDERVWRSLILAESLLGHDTADIIEEMTTHFADLDIDLDDATLDLIDAIHQPHPIAVNA